jgi:hypothetical protein
MDLFNDPTYAFAYSNISGTLAGRTSLAPLGGLNVGGGMVDAGGARAIVIGAKVEF